MIGGEKDGSGRRKAVRALKYWVLAVEVSAANIVCIYIGYLLDMRYEKSPLFIIVFIVIGFAVSINIIFRYLRVFEKDSDRGEGE